jgi:hypothetical protein
VFWRQLEEHDFMDQQTLLNRSQVVLKMDRIEGFSNYLQSGIQKQNYIVLGFQSFTVLEKHFEFAVDLTIFVRKLLCFSTEIARKFYG